MARDVASITVKTETREASRDIKRFGRDASQSLRGIKGGSRDAAAGLRNVKTSSKGAAQELKGASGGAKGLTSSLKGLKVAVVAAAAAFVALKGARAAVAFMGEAAREAEKEQWAMRGLHQVLVSMGRYTPELERSLYDLADALEVQTGYGNDAIITATKFLSTYKQIGNEALPRALQLTLDIARGWGVDLRSAANMVGKAAMGMTGELRRYGITVDQDVYKTRGFIGVMEQIEEQVKGQADAYRKTSTGIKEFMATAWGDVKKQFGYLVNQVLDPLREKIGQVFIGLAQKLKEWRKDVDLRKWAEQTAEKFKDFATSLSNDLIPALNKVIPKLQEILETTGMHFERMEMAYQKVKSVLAAIGNILNVIFPERLERTTEAMKKAGKEVGVAIGEIKEEIEGEPIEPKVDFTKSVRDLHEWYNTYREFKRKIESEPVRYYVKRVVIGPEGEIEREYEKYRKGGLVPRFQKGGFVPGAGFKDTVPAWLRPGEGIIPPESVGYYGKDFIKGIISRTIPKVSDHVIVDFRLGEGSYPVSVEKSDVLSAFLGELKRTQLTQG